MDRQQIEKEALSITSNYFEMIKEMSVSEVCSNIVSDNCNGIYYFKVNGISKRWITDETPVWEQVSDLFVGLSSINVPVSIVFANDKKQLGVYVGTLANYIDILEGMLRSVFPQIVFQKDDSNNKLYEYSDISSGISLKNGGFIKGNPTGSDKFNNVYQIDSIIKGMHSKPWSISIFASPVNKSDTIVRHQKWLSYASACSELSQVTFTNSDSMETTTYHKKFSHSEQYSQKVESFCEKTSESISLGEWCVTINFASDTEANTRLLGGIITSAFYGEDSEPEPVHAVYKLSGNTCNVVNGMQYVQNRFGNIPHPAYSTFLSSKELAIYASFPTVDTTGFSVIDHVEFDVNREESGDLEIGNILDSGNLTENVYSIDSNELNRHCLVVGLTGSGKTNTVKNLVNGLTKDSKRPVLVIEPAKKEYWELYKLGFDNLQVYSVGSNEPYAHTFCINPFERCSYTDSEGCKHAVPIQTHIDFVYAAFKASFIMYTPMPYVLERAIYEIYEDCGWNVHENINVNNAEIYPTIEDLYYKIPEVVTAMGYDSKMRNDLIGSLQARVNSMRLGTKGDTLNVCRSFPFDKILNGNTVIELEDIGDDDVKAFIISLILVNLLEYRRQQEDCQLEVRHLMLIEEAHRLLKNVQSGSGENADPRGAAVEFFCNLLAELRSKGQGFIIADQIPSKLAPDLIKNTNLKIVHRTVSEEERLLMGGAMHMTEEQTESLSSLKQGVAAVFSEGDNRPKLVKSKFAGVHIVSERKNMKRCDVLSAVAHNCISVSDNPDYKSLTNTKNEMCVLCNPHCKKDYRDIINRAGGKALFEQFAKELAPQRLKRCVPNEIYGRITEFLKQNATGAVTECDKACVLNCLIEYWRINKTVSKELIRKFNKRMKGEL